MKKRIWSWILVVALTVVFTVVAQAADDVTIAKDLSTVIALLGLPCGKVVNVVKQSDNDHIATCENGSRYRVFLNAEGRVVAEKQ
jgi:hypothetical protein